MIENFSFKIIYLLITSLILGLDVLSRYDAENGKRNFLSRDQKYIPYGPSIALPLIVVISPLVYFFLDSPSEALHQLISLCYNIFLHIVLYYTLLILCLPLVRKYISARACALLWIIPNYLYITVFFFMQIEKPAFIIFLPGKIIWILIAIWLIGFISVFAWYIISHLRYRSFVLQKAVPVTDLEILELWRKEVYVAGIKKANFELVISPHVTTPMTIGLLKRNMKVVLPSKDYTTEDLQLIYRHELVHIGHEDILTKFFLIFCTAMCWFNPLMWIAVKKTSEDIELSCDETVLISSDETTKRRYAELILKTAGDERGFTTCLSMKAKNLQYRLRNVMNKKKRFSGAFLVGFVFLILALSCGHIALAYNYSTVSEVIHVKKNSEPYQFQDIFDCRAETPPYYTNRVMCLDEEALMNYLDTLPVSALTGNYALSENDYSILVSLSNSEKNCTLGFSDEYLRVSVSSIVDPFDYDYYMYYLPEGLDWEFFDSIISEYPVLDVSMIGGEWDWLKFYPSTQAIWKLDGSEKKLVYETKTPDNARVVVADFPLPYSASLYFSEPVLSDYRINVESLDDLKECILYPSKAPQMEILFPEDPAFYPAKFTVHATFEKYEAEYVFVIE